jgi:N4-gp56 family major capsid protein
MSFTPDGLHPNKGGALTKHLNSGTMDSEIIYADGKHGSMGPELVTEAIDRKVITEAAKKMVFSQFGGTTHLPKGQGKAISKEIILPIMDARNINDQGIDANGVTIKNGNLIGSSKDLNAIASFMPVLTEHGGRVNRVGLTKQKVTGSICHFGFFLEHSKDAFMFSSTPRLEMHVRREMLRAASEIYELNLAQDLHNAAGVVKYGGEALSMEEMSGNVGDVISQITYDGLMKLGITLDDNDTPRDTSIIKGHKNEDTLTVDASRYAIIGSELLPTFIRMKDAHGERAYHPVRHYAAAGSIAEGEAGAVDMFRIIINPFSGGYQGAGKAVTENAGYRTTNGKYDVYSLMVCGKGAFSTISLRGGKNGKKWSVYYRRPEDNRSVLDPYGQTGFFAIDWWYGTLVEKSERLAVYYSVAEL